MPVPSLAMGDAGGAPAPGDTAAATAAQPPAAAPDQPVRKRKREGILRNDFICVTGVSISERETLTGMVRAEGGLVSGGLFGEVTVLVAGHSNTEKVHKAASLGITIVTVNWVHHCAGASTRPDPEGPDYKLLPLSGFTIITCGFQGAESDRINAAIIKHGGLREVAVSKATLPAKSAVVVSDDPSLPREEVLSRAVIKDAYTQCIPVVWEAWLHATAEQGYVSERLIAKHSLIDSEPAVPSRVEGALEAQLREAIAKPLTDFAAAPLRGVSFYLHVGDAEPQCVTWIQACALRLGASRTNTVSLRTTHIVVASPGSRKLLQQQRVAQIASGTLVPSGNLAASFPPPSIVSLDWVFQCLLQQKALPTDAFLYSMAPEAQRRPAEAMPAPRAAMQAPRSSGAAAPQGPMPPLKKARESMGPPPPQQQQQQGVGKDPSKAHAAKVKKAQAVFGSSEMFSGKVFVASANFARHGKQTAGQLIVAHGGTVVPQGKLGEGDTVSYFVDPHHPSRDPKAARQHDKPVPGAQVITEDWLTHCWHYLKALRALAAEKDAASFRTLAEQWGHAGLRVAGLPFAEGLVVAARALADLEAGAPGALPDPVSHFMFHLAVQRRHLPAEGRGVAPSPFLQHGKLRTAKKEGVGVAVCFEGFGVNHTALMAKAVELLGGKVTRDFDSFVTTHVVVTKGYLHSTAGRGSKLLRKAMQSSEKGGSDIVMGVEPDWLVTSAGTGYFVEETPAVVLFPERARGDAPPPAEGGVEATAPTAPASASGSLVSVPTPVVQTRVQDPPTPSPRVCLDFDATMQRKTAVRIYFALSGKAGVAFPFKPLDFMKAAAANLRGSVAHSCGDATHLVTSTIGTTETACIALASGKWVITPQWVSDSAERGSWQPEAAYEWCPDKVLEIAEANRLPLQGREVGKARVLAGAAQFWRQAGGGAFKGWRVRLVAEDAYLATLQAGGAEILSRSLPPSWDDMAGGMVLVSKGRLQKMRPAHREAIAAWNNVRLAELGGGDGAGGAPTSVSQCTGMFLLIDAVSSHLQRSFLDLNKLACGASPGAAVSPDEVPAIPW